MKSEELRIGNFVYDKLYPSNELRRIIIKYGAIIDNSEHFEPIPLTKEWLLDFGFEKCETLEEQGYKKGIYKLFANSLDEINFCFFDFGDWYQHIDYVHQLQNIYFALTGEELEFKTK